MLFISSLIAGFGSQSRKRHSRRFFFSFHYHHAASHAAFQAIAAARSPARIVLPHCALVLEVFDVWEDCVFLKSLFFVFVNVPTHHFPSVLKVLLKLSQNLEENVHHRLRKIATLLRAIAICPTIASVFQRFDFHRIYKLTFG